MRVSAGLPTGMEGLTHPIPFSDPENVIRIAQTATHEEINLIGTPAEAIDKALAFKEAGVTRLLGLYFAANSVQELLDQMQLFAEELMPKVK